MHSLRTFVKTTRRTTVSQKYDLNIPIFIFCHNLFYSLSKINKEKNKIIGYSLTKANSLKLISKTFDQSHHDSHFFNLFHNHFNKLASYNFFNGQNSFFSFISFGYIILNAISRLLIFFLSI